MHKVEIKERVLEPENGLMIGNGDLSVSIYQTEDLVIWRFGKNNVWDRRLDLSDCPEAAHIDEMIRGIREEGWTSHGGYVDAHVTAKGNVADEKRMNEVCNGWPAYARRPFPCPKPVGELALHIPIDQRGLRIRQKLTIEKGVIDISLRWQSGVRIDLSCFIPPSPNVLVVNWEVTNWIDETATPARSPVWFTLYRWPDPRIEDFAREMLMRAMYPHNFRACIASGKATPLPPPTVEQVSGRDAIVQSFYPDIEYEEGFSYAMVPMVTDMRISECSTFDTGWAALHVGPERDQQVLEGSIAVAVPTSTDAGGVAGGLVATLAEVKDNLTAAVKKWAGRNRRSAREYWSKSAIEIADPLMENMWYEQLHFRSCAYRAGVIAPGLAMPSTIQDYSLWHGDYHMNYNYQQPFWGDYMANHPEVADSFFPGLRHMVDIGYKIAEKYWGYRGTFIQISGYPFPVEDDPYGSGPLSRMTYMNGWLASHYWYKYLYTGDREWLRETGYPVMRDVALFYVDFLEKWDDGLYHAFPSLQGEKVFGGDPDRFTDQPQVLRHIRYNLMTTIAASELLDVDEDLRAEWRACHDNLVPADDLDALGFSDEEKRRYFINPPEFQGMDVGYNFPRPGAEPPSLKSEPGGRWGSLGTACFPWQLLTYLHNGAFDPERDYPHLRDFIFRLRQPNGSLPAMPQQTHGFIGLYGESHGMCAPLQEMMLQSWDGIIRIFPAWPREIEASFSTFRAEGAFLVSSSWKNGEVSTLTVESVIGGRCVVLSPWGNAVEVRDSNGLVNARFDDNVITIETAPGMKYQFNRR